MPLPIPNREVKPEGADGNAIRCGSVGCRPFFILKKRITAVTLLYLLFTKKMHNLQ